MLLSFTETVTKMTRYTNPTFKSREAEIKTGKNCSCISSSPSKNKGVIEFDRQVK
jgi:hypothetical protein